MGLDGHLQSKQTFPKFSMIYGSVLQVALNGGHEAVVWLLLEKDADINVQGGCYSSRRHQLVVM